MRILCHEETLLLHACWTSVFVHLVKQYPQLPFCSKHTQTHTLAELLGGKKTGVLHQFSGAISESHVKSTNLFVGIYKEMKLNVKLYSEMNKSTFLLILWTRKRHKVRCKHIIFKQHQKKARMKEHQSVSQQESQCVCLN